MKNQKGISLIALIITIIVIIILAAIVLIAANTTTEDAKFSRFAQEFGDYALNFKADPLKDVQLKYGTEGQAITLQQAVCEATGATFDTGDIVPACYNFNNFASLEGGSKDDLTATTPCYFIPDTNSPMTPTDGLAANITTAYPDSAEIVEGYKANHKFYGDNYGKETHWVTGDGVVFTLPGYPRKMDDGSYRFYVTADTYYTATETELGTKTIYAVDAKKVDAVKARTETVTP